MLSGVVDAMLSAGVDVMLSASVVDVIITLACFSRCC